MMKSLLVGALISVLFVYAPCLLIWRFLGIENALLFVLLLVGQRVQSEATKAHNKEGE